MSDTKSELAKGYHGRCTKLGYICGSCYKCGAQAAATENSPVVKLSRCSRCKRVAYCGRSCQTADFQAHKAMCKAWEGVDKLALAQAHNIKDLSTEQRQAAWNKYVKDTMNALTVAMGTRLNVEQRNLVVYGNKCALCYAPEPHVRLSRVCAGREVVFSRARNQRRRSTQTNLPRFPNNARNGGAVPWGLRLLWVTFLCLCRSDQTVTCLVGCKKMWCVLMSLFQCLLWMLFDAGVKLQTITSQMGRVFQMEKSAIHSVSVHVCGSYKSLCVCDVFVGQRCAVYSSVDHTSSRSHCWRPTAE